MSYIAPRLKQSSVSIVAEELVPNSMVERIAAQGKIPRVSIAFWDFPSRSTLAIEGFCKPIDPAAAHVKNSTMRRSRTTQGRSSSAGASVVAIGLLYNERGIREAQACRFPPAGRSAIAQTQGAISITSAGQHLRDGKLLMLARLNGGSELNIDLGSLQTRH